MCFSNEQCSHQACTVEFGKKCTRKDCLRMKRIGMLTSGGDCQALNAAMRGVVKGLSNNVDELRYMDFTMDTKD